jgi:transposase
VCIETLNIAGMLRNRHLAKAVADAAMGEVGRRIGNKAEWYGCDLHHAGQWYPSSKTCSRCSNVKDRLDLSERTYHCDVCGLDIDRDLNAPLRWDRGFGSEPVQALISARDERRPDGEQAPQSIDSAVKESQCVSENGTHAVTPWVMSTGLFRTRASRCGPSGRARVTPAH